MFTAKAWNGRVICQWLSACLRDAASTQNYVGRCDVPLPLMSSCASLVRFQVDCARVNEEQQARCYDVLNMMPHLVKAVTAFTVDGLVSWGKCMLCRVQSLGSIPWHVFFLRFSFFSLSKAVRTAKRETVLKVLFHVFAGLITPNSKSRSCSAPFYPQTTEEFLKQL